jgi:hypothetical protein
MKGERLIQGRSASGRALAAFEARTAEPAAGAEERAWRALQARLAAPPPSRRWAIWPASLGASAAVALVLALYPAHRPALPVQSAAPSAAPPPVTVAAPAPPAEPLPLVLSPRLRPLSGGPIRLAGGALLYLGQRTRAQGSEQGGQTRLVLESGTLTLTVAPGRPDRVSVVAGPYRFVDLGTIFRVTRTGKRVHLRVDEGRVAVWRGHHLVAAVNAGGHWSSPAAPTPVAADLVAPEDPIQSCAASLAEGSARDAVACYRRLAGGGTLAAEAALYEEARVLTRHLRDLPGALATLREHRRRFPRGALRAEVDLTLVELLPRLGRYQEALDESGALLSHDPRHERAAELHLLRGNLLRESFRDYPRAALEYAAVRDVVRPGDDPAIADDAAFFEAVCLEASRRPEAADAYRRYLAGGAPRHAAEARARLSAIGP